MIGRLRLGVVAFAAALFVAPALTPAGHLSAQQEVGGRFRVLIPNLFPLEGADDDFGKDVAKELRKAINKLPTHQPIEEDEIKDQLRRFKLKMDELDCTKTRQLGGQINAQVALCASYTESGDERDFKEIKFIDLGSSQEFDVEPFQANKDQKEEAAQRIVDAFDTYVQQIRFKQFCSDYANSSDWESSLRNCDDALELNPKDEGVMYQRAVTLWKMDRLEDALSQLETLLEQAPYHDEGLQLAGYLATTLGQKDEGRTFYGRYLELNPGAVDVRRNIAYDMFKAGDPEGAMLLIQEGLQGQDQSPELLGDLGNYAFAAARNALPEGAGQQGGEDQEVPPQVAELYRTAIDAYTKMYDQRADSMGVSQLRSVVVAHIQLDELQQAEQFAQRVLQTHPQEPVLLSVYSTVLEREDKTEQAVQELAKIESIDPDFENLYVRQANLYMAAGDRDKAEPLFHKAVERGQDPSVVSKVIFSDAYQKGVQNKNWNYALQGIQMAKTFDVNAETKQMLDFWHGWVLYSQAIDMEKPETLDTAKKTLPLFQQAKTLFQSGTPYANTQPSVNINQILNATDQYIEIQQLIIKRGG